MSANGTPPQQYIAPYVKPGSPGSWSFTLIKATSETGLPMDLVLITVQTAGGTNQFFCTPDDLEKLGTSAIDIARQSKSGIIIANNLPPEKIN